MQVLAPLLEGVEEGTGASADVRLIDFEGVLDTTQQGTYKPCDKGGAGYSGDSLI